MKHKIFIKIIIGAVVMTCLFTFYGCAQSKESIAQDPPVQNLPTQDTVIEDNNNGNENQNNSIKDTIDSQVKFGKKYYYLGYDGIVQTEYYTINQDGTATYTHIMKSGDKVTFHQEIHFKWIYSGERNCALIHNGTKMIKGEQDDAFGFSRIMHLSKDVVYWSASGENTYYLCEDSISQIPNYAKFI